MLSLRIRRGGKLVLTATEPIAPGTQIVVYIDGARDTDGAPLARVRARVDAPAAVNILMVGPQTDEASARHVVAGGTSTA